MQPKTVAKPGWPIIASILAAWIISIGMYNKLKGYGETNIAIAKHSKRCRLTCVLALARLLLYRGGRYPRS